MWREASALLAVTQTGMEEQECACLCGAGLSRGCRCRQEGQEGQEGQGPAETVVGPAETAAAHSRPALGLAPEEEQLQVAEGAAAGPCAGDGGICAGDGGICAGDEGPCAGDEGPCAGDGGPCAGDGGAAGPRAPPPESPGCCSLQDLPCELLVEIFASLPGPDLARLAQTCTRFRHVLHTDSIWRRRCREEYGACGNLQNLERVGTSCREVYAKLLHPCRDIFGLWRPGNGPYGGLLDVGADGVYIVGWMYQPSLNTQPDARMRCSPVFRIRLTEEGKAILAECLGGHRGPHSCIVQIQKENFFTECSQMDYHGISDWDPEDVGRWLREEWVQVVQDIFQENRLHFILRKFVYQKFDYRRLHLPQSHPDDPIRPGLFRGTYDTFCLPVVMLGFHGKHARVTKVTGDVRVPAGQQVIEVDLMHRIQPLSVEIFRSFSRLSRIVQEVHEQVIQGQQRQEDRAEDGEGPGWQSPGQHGVGESGAAALKAQPVQFVLPAGVTSSHQNYPRTCRMCFYGVGIAANYGFASPRRLPGIFILFDEDHFGFIWLELKHFSLYCRGQIHHEDAAEVF